MQASASHSNVSLLKSRPVAYKLGLILLISSFLLFGIAFSSDYWVAFDNSFTFKFYGLRDHAGLWDAPCADYGFSCHTGILVARIVFSFHLAGYIICIAVVLVENYKKVNPISYHSKILELCVFATAITGFAGMAVFVAWYSASLPYKSFKWSLILTSLSLAGICCSLFLFMYGNRRGYAPTRGTVLQQPQQSGAIFYNCAPPHPAGYQPYQAPQSQPLLTAQPYLYPPGSQYQGAPPPYTFPPAYPLAPMQPPVFSPTIYPEHQAAGRVQASAPHYDDTLP